MKANIYPRRSGSWNEYLEKGIPQKCKLFKSGVTSTFTTQGVFEKWDRRNAVGELMGRGGLNLLIHNSKLKSQRVRKHKPKYNAELATAI